MGQMLGQLGGGGPQQGVPIGPQSNQMQSSGGQQTAGGGFGTMPPGMMSNLLSALGTTTPGATGGRPASKVTRAQNARAVGMSTAKRLQQLRGVGANTPGMDQVMERLNATPMHAFMMSGASGPNQQIAGVAPGNWSSPTMY